VILRALARVQRGVFAAREFERAGQPGLLDNHFEIALHIEEIDRLAAARPGFGLTPASRQQRQRWLLLQTRPGPAPPGRKRRPVSNRRTRDCWRLRL
jgi:hypothetical protein